jgi:hypothetical protein
LCTVRWENHLPALNSKNSITSMKFVSKVNTALFAIVTCALWSLKPGLRVQALYYILEEGGAPAKLSESFG